MSHQTGIQASERLRVFLGKCRDGKIRIMKIKIEEETLCLDDYRESLKTWEEDYADFVLPFVKKKQPCYIFFRLDTKNSTGYEWIFISWSPDNSPVREKMLYASTKATLKKEFGGGQIKHDIFATTEEEISLKGYKRHLTEGKVPAPLTIAEEELQMIKMKESNTDVGVETRQQSLQGIMFPITVDALSAITDLKQGDLNYVQLFINLEKEEIHLAVKEKNLHVSKFSKHVPKDHARYHMFRFAHSYEGDRVVNNVFMYSVPGCNCPIKERMLYSSCKSQFLNYVELQSGIVFDKKIEIDDPSEVSEEFLLNEIHPKKSIFKQKFAKPKGPGHRGARRLIRSPPKIGEGENTA